MRLKEILEKQLELIKLNETELEKIKAETAEFVKLIKARLKDPNTHHITNERTAIRITTGTNIELTLSANL